MKYLTYTILVLVFVIPNPLHAAAASTPTPSSEWEFIRDASGRRFGKEITKEASYDEDDLLSVYRMRKGVLTDHLKTKDKIAPTDQAIWDMFTAIASKETVTKRMAVFATYEDATASTLGYVDGGTGKEPSWMLAVNANAARPESIKWTREMGVVLIHEYAHILTLNKDQLEKHKRAAVHCKKLGTYRAERYGCTKSTAYLNKYVERFWTTEEMKVSEQARERNAAADVYWDNKDNFVTWYAATSPEEDIAESFTDFILRKKPTGTTEKEQKILFFYEYPELVKMRTTIRTNVERYFR